MKIPYTLMRKTLHLPTGLTAIESGAFQGTGAEMIVIPEHVTSIADGAFDEGVVLQVVPGSWAEQWAVTHDWPHKN